MAIVKPGAIGLATGSIGSTTLAAGKGTLVARLRGRAPLRSSSQALQARANFAATAALWRSSAMQSQRAAWIKYAQQNPVPDRFGVRRLISGFQWFMKCAAIQNALGFVTTFPPEYDAKYRVIITSYTFDQDPTLILDGSYPYKPGQTVEAVFISRRASTINKNARPFWQLLGCHMKYASSTDYSADMSAKSLIPLPGESWLVYVIASDRFHLPSPPWSAILTAP